GRVVQRRIGAGRLEERGRRGGEIALRELRFALSLVEQRQVLRASTRREDLLQPPARGLVERIALQRLAEVLHRALVVVQLVERELAGGDEGLDRGGDVAADAPFGFENLDCARIVPALEQHPPRALNRWNQMPVDP